MTKVRRIRKKILIRLVAILLLLLVLFQLYQILVQNVILPMTRGQLEKITGTSVDIGDMTFKPNGAATIKDLKIASSLKGEGITPFFTARQVEAKIAVSSILMFKPRVKSLVMNDFVADITYNTKLSAWNLPRFKSTGGGKKKFPFVQLNNGAIRFRMLHGDKEKNFYTIGLKNGGVFPAEKDADYNFSFRTNSSDSGIQSFFKGHWGRGEKGTLVIGSDNFSTGKVPVFGNTLDTRQLELEMEYSPEKLSIKKLKWLMGENSSVAISGSISDYQSEGKYDLNIDMRNTRVSRTPISNGFVYGSGLGSLLGSSLNGLLEKYNPNGIGDLDVHLAGRLNDPSKIKISGTARPKDVSINYYKFPYKIDHLNGDIKFSEKSAIIEKLLGKHDDVDVEIEGVSKLTDEGLDYEINIFSPNMLLGEDLYWALSEEKRNLVYTFSPQGRARIDCRISRKAGQKPESYLTIDLLNAEADYLHFPYHLENVTGRIVIAPDRIDLINLVSNSKDRKITLNGKVTETRSSRPQYNIIINAGNIPVDSRLRAALPYYQRNFYDSFKIDAKANAEIKIFPNQVGKRLVEYIAKITVNDANLVYEDFPIPLTGVNVDAVLTPDGTFLRELKGKNGNGEVKVNGTVWPANEKSGDPGFCLSLNADNIEIEGDWLNSIPDEVRGVLNKFNPTGAVNIRADLKKNSRIECPEFQIAIDCLGNSLSIPGFDYPVENVFGKIILFEDKAVFENIRAGYGNGIKGSEVISLNGKVLKKGDHISRGDFTLSATDILFDERLEKVFNVFGSDLYSNISPSGRFDLNINKFVFENSPAKDRTIDYSGDLILKDCSFQGGKTISGLSAKIEAEGFYRIGAGLLKGHASIKAPSMKIKNRQLEALSFDVSYDPVKAAFKSNEFTANCYGGKVIGNIVLERIAPKEFEYVLKSSFSNLNFNEIVAAGRNTDTDSYEKGTVEGLLAVKGILGNNESHKGKLGLRVSDMEFAKQTLLGKIVTASQFVVPSNYIFSDLRAESYIQGDNLLFESIEFFGPSIQLKGHGNASLSTGKLDLNFSGYGRNTRKEPTILESFFRGIGSGIVSTKITGTINEPDITTEVLPMIRKPFEILGKKE